MLANTKRSRGWLVLLGLLLAAGGTTPQSASAQQGADDGYSVTEAGRVKAPEPVSPAGTQENTGPVRLARFAFVQGNVTWRTDESTDWSTATVNLPLRQGAQIWVSEGGRAEIQFDDGSLLRLGTGAVVTLQTLYSDSDGEFTELKMTEGLASLRIRHDRGVYQVNTPLGSVKAAGPASLRIGVGNGLEVALKSGKATLEGGQGKSELQSGDFLDLAGASSPYTVRDIPRLDSWDRWNQDRDDLLTRAEAQPAREHLPANIAIVANDLNDYGTWRDDSQDGWVWCPRVSSSDWRPYHEGHWTWVNPFGWTWVSSEAWGWAPYHYGTWVSRPYGWAWCPGPVNQYWSPAVVNFSECEGQIAWCPLAPSEVRYPSSIGFGFQRGNWATYFAIGGAAVYYPTGNGYCAPRVYDTRYVNRVTYVTNVTNVTNVYNGNSAALNRFGLSQESYAANNNTYLNGRSAFIPVNSRTAAGVTSVRSADFGGRGTYVSVVRADSSLFTRGQVIAAPLQGRAPVAGPIGVKPTLQAMTPTRTFTTSAPTGTVRQTRPVFRAPVASVVAQNSVPITPTGRIALVPQTGFVKPTMGLKSSGSISRNDRFTPAPRGGNNGTTTSASTGPTPGRTKVQTGGDGSQSLRSGRGNGTAPGTGNNPDKRTSVTGNNPDKRTPASDAKGSSAAEAAAQARASVGFTNRGRSNGNASDGNGNINGTARTPRDNGSSSAGNRGAAPDNSAPVYTPRQTQPTRQNNEPPTRTEPRQTQPNPQRNEPPTRSEQPRSEPRQTQPAPQRSEPTRTEPTRSEPARSEPRQTQPAPPRSEPDKTPPASKGSGSEKDSGSKDSGTKDSGSKGSDSTNRGRPGRGG
jgi:hypothetical protein